MNKIAISAVFAVVFLLASFTAWAADSDKKGTVSSLSASMISVPNVCDMSLSKAISTLTAAGLKPQTQLSDRDGQARICIRQNPEAGERVPKGTTVNIYGQLANNAMISVPNVCDMSLSKAISTLTAAGLKPQTQLSDRDGQARICIRQNPEAGERVPKGTTVNIYGQLANDAKGKVVIPSR